MNPSGMIFRSLLILVAALTLMTACGGGESDSAAPPVENTSPIPKTPIPEESQPTVTLDTEYFGISDSELAKQKGPGTPHTAVIDDRTITVSRIYSQMQLDMECETAFMLNHDDLVSRIVHTFQQPYGTVLMKLQEGLGSQGQLEQNPEYGIEQVFWDINGFRYTITSSTTNAVSITIDKSVS